MKTKKKYNDDDAHDNNNNHNCELIKFSQVLPGVQVKRRRRRGRVWPSMRTSRRELFTDNSELTNMSSNSPQLAYISLYSTVQFLLSIVYCVYAS